MKLAGADKSEKHAELFEGAAESHTFRGVGQIELPAPGLGSLNYDLYLRAPCKGGAFQWVQVPPGQTLQPEATGAVMEVTKWLKPSV